MMDFFFFFFKTCDLKKENITFSEQCIFELFFFDFLKARFNSLGRSTIASTIEEEITIINISMRNDWIPLK